MGAGFTRGPAVSDLFKQRRVAALMLVLCSGLTVFADDFNRPNCRAMLTGCLILDGTYIPAPYRVAVSPGGVSVNGIAIDLDRYRLSRLVESELLVRPISAGSNPHAMTMHEEVGSEIKYYLHEGAIVSLQEDATPTLIEDPARCASFFRTVVCAQGPCWPPSSTGQVPPATAQPVEVSPALQAHARDYLQHWDRLEGHAEGIVLASVWGSALGYPMTLFAMIAVVVAFGHLLSNKPRIDPRDPYGPGAQVVVARSLAIVAALSAVDLVMTIIASQTGTMREMNPIGQNWIGNPWQLATFKTVVVSFSILLLYHLHQRPLAQVASWWSCLVLTLLTARWLTFQSMFM